MREAQLEAEAEAIEAEIRRLTRLAFTKLGENYDLINSGATIPASKSREMLGDVTRATHFLIRILRHAGVIENG